MKIGIEMRLVTMGSAGGIAMLLRGVLRAAFQRFPQHDFLCFNTVFNHGLLAEVPHNVTQVTLSLDSYFADVGRHCQEQAVDVLFRGYPLEQQVDFPLNRQVVQIPDIQHEYYPEFFGAEVLRSRRAAFGQALGGAGAIGTISEHARQTLLSQPGTACRDIFLMSPALQPELVRDEPLSSAEQALIPRVPFFLYPANLWKHKNHQRVLLAFERFLSSARRPIELVFMGHPSGWEHHQKQFGHLPIRHLGFVRPALLQRLMNQAQALVFFSLYEGFGMPLLEAFHAGTPVLCSNTTSLPEVGGDAVLSCDPTDINAMSALMSRILQEPELRFELVVRGRNRLAKFSWEQSADNLIAACQRVAEREQLSQPANLPSVSVQTWPRLALVTPSYNQGRYLAQTINSVLEQDYPLLDYLVVDGLSNDDTPRVLRSFGDRVRWVSEPDLGQAHAINKGLAQLKGDVQGYLNSDDVLLPGALEKAAIFLVTHPDCDVVYGKARFIDADRNVLGDYPSAEYSFDRLMADCCISQPAAFWRSRIVERVGPFDQSLHFALDYDYWQRIDKAGGKFEHLAQYLACTRIHSQTKTSSRHTEMMREIIGVSMKNAGFASLNYYQGLWHSMSRERGWRSWLLRRVPCFPPIMSRLHHRWANRRTYGNWDLWLESAGTLKKHAGERLRPVRNLAKKARRILSAQRARQLLAVGGAKKVEGFWGDNWLSDMCSVRLPDSLAGDVATLTGVAVESLQLVVTMKGSPAQEFFLEGGKPQAVAFQLAPGNRRHVTLKFSKSYLDAAGRRLAFIVHGTNLFSEQDWAS